MSDYKFGIRPNIEQFIHQLLQVFFVGLTLGMTRTVIPALAESEFDVPKGSFMLLIAFVVAFGFVKGAMNFVAGRLSEVHGRKEVLIWGWLFALPIPPMIFFAPSWSWIVAAMLLLGINQGLAWSMTQTAKLDITHASQRGLTIGFNEFAGYFGVALAGLLTGYLSEYIPPREALLWFGSVVLLLALINGLTFVVDTLPWAKSEAENSSRGRGNVTRAAYPKNISDNPTNWEIFSLTSWRDKRMFAFCQAGLVEKFVDALVWVFYPVFVYQQRVSLANIGWIVGVYGFVWGVSQFFTGRLSDKIGRRKPIIWGMWLCGAGVALTLLYDDYVWWLTSAAITGFGMALLYPNISAAVSDISHPSWRGSAIGIYRFWRDLGYGIGALLLGLVAYLTGEITSGFWFTAGAMFLSGLVVVLMGRETHPVLLANK